LAGRAGCVYHGAMQTDRASRIVIARRALVGAVVLLLVAGCPFRPTAPQSRAEYFIDKLIQAPQDTDDLRAVVWLTAGQNPEMLISDLPTRTAVTYLRARARSGAALGVHAAGVTTLAPDRQRVQLDVTETGAARSEPVRFDAELEKRGQEWRVVRLHAD
jgi:hypothetical protein